MKCRIFPLSVGTVTTLEDWARAGKMAKSNPKSNSAYCHRERIAYAMRGSNKSGLPTGIRLISMNLGEMALVPLYESYSA